MIKVEKIYLNNLKDVFLKTYIQNPSPEMPHTSVRPAILIIPGGGYQFVSDREGEVLH